MKTCFKINELEFKEELKQKLWKTTYLLLKHKAALKLNSVFMRWTLR